MLQLKPVETQYNPSKLTRKLTIFLLQKMIPSHKAHEADVEEAGQKTSTVKTCSEHYIMQIQNI